MNPTTVPAPLTMVNACLLSERPLGVLIFFIGNYLNNSRSTYLLPAHTIKSKDKKRLPINISAPTNIQIQEYLKNSHTIDLNLLMDSLCWQTIKHKAHYLQTQEENRENKFDLNYNKEH